MGIPIVPNIEECDSSGSKVELDDFGVVVDALFGFSFSGPVRAPFEGLISYIAKTKIPTISVDIPSGWNVDLGDVYLTGVLPQAVISLTGKNINLFCMCATPCSDVRFSLLKL